jgi:hypothetical protein
MGEAGAGRAAAEPTKLAAAAVELARRGQPENVRDVLATIAKLTRAAGRERAALSRLVALARSCECRADPHCLHAHQVIRLVEYLQARPLARPDQR